MLIYPLLIPGLHPTRYTTIAKTPTTKPKKSKISSWLTQPGSHVNGTDPLIPNYCNSDIPKLVCILYLLHNIIPGSTFLKNNFNQLDVPLLVIPNNLLGCAIPAA